MDATVDVEPYLSAGITPAVLEIKDENKIVFLLKEVKSFFLQILRSLKEA